jgi:hypothetical protein
MAATGTGAGASAIRGSVGGSAGEQSQVVFRATPDNESEWRADRPPGAWPSFPAGHALARSGVKRTGPDAVAAAGALEQRWAQFRAGTSPKRPTTGEIHEALRTLMAVDAKSVDYPAAWAAFVRLRRIERESVAS